MRSSVRANPFTVASGVRRSWHARLTSFGNVGSSVIHPPAKLRQDTPLGMADLRHLTVDDIQASVPEVRIALSRAGVTGVEKAIRIRHGDSEKLIAATIDCTVDLDGATKGVHMSRFPELFEQAIEDVVIGEALLVEDLAEHIAREIAERQRAGRAEVRIVARYPMEQRTPVTGLATQQVVSLIGIAAA